MTGTSTSRSHSSCSQSTVAKHSTIDRALVGTSTDLFQRVLALHVPPGSTVADVTCGHGTFWCDVDESLHDLRKSDLVDGIDFRELACSTGIGCVVVDFLVFRPGRPSFELADLVPDPEPGYQRPLVQRRLSSARGACS